LFKALFLSSALLLSASVTRSQAPAPMPLTTSARPLPDIGALMREVETHQRAAEELQKNYIYREFTSMDQLNGKGETGKTESREFEVFWLNGVRGARRLKKDGKDLNPDETKREDERIDKMVIKAKERREKADAQGKQSDSAGHDEITFSRMLELGTFSNARRESIGGRDTIAVDYTGDPKARTHSAAEAVFHELAGSVWIDEEDKAIQHLEGHFLNNFKMGGGMLVNIRQGTWFKASFVKVNHEVWLPQDMEGAGHVRYLLFFSVDGNFRGKTYDYRKFKATSRVLPNQTPEIAPSDSIPTPRTDSKTPEEPASGLPKN